MLVRALTVCLGIALGLMLLPGGGQAATFGSFSLPTNGFMFFNQQVFASNAAVNDTYIFDAPGALTSFAVAVPQDANPPNHPPNPPSNFGIMNLTMTWQELGVSQQFTDGAGVLDQNAVLTASFLMSGTYHLIVTGTALLSGGAYSYTLSTTPVPAALVLFGSGLLGLTLLSRGRRKAVDLSS